MNGQDFNISYSFRLVGVEISDYLRHGHVADMAVAAGKKLGFLCRSRKLFLATNLAL